MNANLLGGKSIGYYDTYTHKSTISLVTQLTWYIIKYT